MKKKKIILKNKQIKNRKIPMNVDSNNNNNKNNKNNKINNCYPLITKLVSNNLYKSEIASISYKCLSLISLKIKLNIEEKIIKKFDNCLYLLSQAEIILNNNEKNRLREVNNVNNRVSFCSYDMSTVTTPIFGELNSIKDSKIICNLLVKSGIILLSLFKSNNSNNKNIIGMFINELLKYKSQSSKYLLHEFEYGYNNKILYPFYINIVNLLSSMIRFYLKTIWNASEFLENNKNNNKLTMPKWYKQMGTYSFTNENTTEFIPYHAAELTINLKAYYELNNLKNCNKNCNKNKNYKQLMDELGIIDNPLIFFDEMRQVLINVNYIIYGQNNNNKQTEFGKYLMSKWKELRLCLNNVKKTNA
eukprot:20151_1